MELKTIEQHSTKDIKKTIKYLKKNTAVSKYDGMLLFTELIKQFEEELIRRK